MAGESRQRVKHNFTIFSKNVNILEMHDHIWNHHEKCIQISTNLMVFGSLIREIDVKMSDIGESKIDFCSVKPETVPRSKC